MADSPLLIVKTNFDWQENLTSRPDEDILKRELILGPYRIMDILGYHFDDPVYGYGAQLEKLVQAYREGPITPCLELRPAKVIFHPSRRTSNFTYIMENPPTDDISSLLNPEMLDPFFKERFPRDLVFDLVFDFVSNRGRYDAALNKLKSSPHTKYVEIRRLNVNPL